MYLRFIILILVIFSSCSTTEDDLWTEKRDSLLGTWDGNVSFVQTNLSSNKDSIGIRKSKVNFLNKEYVNFNYLDFSGFESNYNCNWAYQPEPEIIVFYFPDHLWFYGVPQKFKIIQKGTNTQVWKTEFFNLDYDPITQKTTNYRYTETWEMTKQ